MAEKIILFLSDLKPSARPASYTFQGGNAGDAVSGTQTNEAPVKWLLRMHPGITQIICFCSPESTACATQRAADGTVRTAEKSAFAHFSDEIGRFRKAASPELVALPYHASESLERDLLPKLLPYIASEDVIYLDLTGGMRNDNLNLFLLSRVLNYTGVIIGGAVYSNFQTKQVEDMTRLIHTFDLVEGVQDFTSFGSVKKLRAYYGTPAKDPTVEKLLTTMETLIHNITLCRINNINVHMKAFSKALNRARHCGDPLLEQLLPTFRRKYCKGADNSMTTPELITWCLDSDMVQQAVTLYTERIPAYLVDEKFLTIGTLEENVQQSVEKEGRKSHQDENVILFDKDLLYRGKGCPNRKDAPCIYAKTIECLGEALENTPYTLNRSEYEMQQILRDYIYLKMVRNMINHANDQNVEDRKSQESYLQRYEYPPVDHISVADIRAVLTDAIQHLR